MASVHGVQLQSGQYIQCFGVIAVAPMTVQCLQQPNVESDYIIMCAVVQAEAEARRRQRWGESSQQRAWSGRYESAPGGRGYGGGRRDFLGYYAMLGLDAEGGLVSEGDVKRAFREAALRWHPDRQKVGTVHRSGDLVILSSYPCSLWPHNARCGPK